MTTKKNTVHTEPVVTIEADLFEVVDLIKQLNNVQGDDVGIKQATVVLHNYGYDGPVGTLHYEFDQGAGSGEWNFEAHRG